MSVFDIGLLICKHIRYMYRIEELILINDIFYGYLLVACEESFYVQSDAISKFRKSLKKTSQFLLILLQIIVFIFAFHAFPMSSRESLFFYTFLTKLLRCVHERHTCQPGPKQERIESWKFVSQSTNSMTFFNK